MTFFCKKNTHENKKGGHLTADMEKYGFKIRLNFDFRPEAIHIFQ